MSQNQNNSSNMKTEIHDFQKIIYLHSSKHPFSQRLNIEKLSDQELGNYHSMLISIVNQIPIETRSYLNNGESLNLVEKSSSIKNLLNASKSTINFGYYLMKKFGLKKTLLITLGISTGAHVVEQMISGENLENIMNNFNPFYEVSAQSPEYTDLGTVTSVEIGEVEGEIQDINGGNHEYRDITIYLDTDGDGITDNKVTLNNIFEADAYVEINCEDSPNIKSSSLTIEEVENLLTEGTEIKKSSTREGFFYNLKDGNNNEITLLETYDNSPNTDFENYSTVHKLQSPICPPNYTSTNSINQNITINPQGTGGSIITDFFSDVKTYASLGGVGLLSYLGFKNGNEIKQKIKQFKGRNHLIKENDTILEPTKNTLNYLEKIKFSNITTPIEQNLLEKIVRNEPKSLYNHITNNIPADFTNKKTQINLINNFVSTLLKKKKNQDELRRNGRNDLVLNEKRNELRIKNNTLEYLKNLDLTLAEETEIIKLINGNGNNQKMAFREIREHAETYGKLSGMNQIELIDKYMEQLVNIK